MTYKGYVKNGMVVAAEPLPLPEGTEVRIEAVVPPVSADATEPRPLVDRLASIIGKAEHMPADWSENHDAYLREQHRR